MEIIPAIDIIEGKCVRLTQGNYSQCKIYSDSPLDVAQAFEGAGMKRLHLVDLDGAKASTVVNRKILEKICHSTRLSVDFGGGIKSGEDIRQVFEAGADYACIGSIAQADRDKMTGWLERYGGNRIIIGADVWNTKICVRGWKKVTDTTIYEFVEWYKSYAPLLMCTDITRDGMLAGPSVPFYEELLKKYPEIHWIASGGVGRKEDLSRLAEIGVKSVVVGKALYEKRITLEMLKNFC